MGSKYPGVTLQPFPRVPRWRENLIKRREEEEKKLLVIITKILRVIDQSGDYEVIMNPFFSATAAKAKKKYRNSEP